MENKKVLDLIAKAVEDHKGLNLEILDVSKITIVADYFIIVSGRSKLHVDAVARGIIDELKQHDIPIKSKEGSAEGGWILLDLADIVVHVFSEEQRKYYGLDKLWQDAPRIMEEIHSGSSI